MPMITGPVIVVDDDDAVRQSLKFALELEGLSVRLYRDADHFLAESDLPPRVVSSSITGWRGSTASTS